MIKNIIFDMGNVLLAYTPDKYITTLTEDAEAAEAVLRELFRSSEWQELDAGSITEESAVKSVSLRIPQYSDLVGKAMDNWHSDLTPIEGMAVLVEKLKSQNYNIYLLSNTSMKFFSYMDKVEMFKHFNGFIISARERLVKPDRKIFECICSRFGLTAGECLFIDDLQPNIDGAESAGFNAHLFQGAEELTQFLKNSNIL